MSLLYGMRCKLPSNQQTWRQQAGKACDRSCQLSGRNGGGGTLQHAAPLGFARWAYSAGFAQSCHSSWLLSSPIQTLARRPRPRRS